MKVWGRSPGSNPGGGCEGYTRYEAGGGCEGLKKTVLLATVVLFALLMVSTTAQAGGGVGSGAEAHITVDGGGVGSGSDIPTTEGGGVGSGSDIPTTEGGGVGSG